MSLAAWTLLGTTGASTPPPDPPLGPFNYLEQYTDDEGAESMMDDNASVRKVYLVDWSQRGQFLDDLLGSAQVGGTVTGGSVLARVLPEQHPEWKNFYAVDADSKYVGPAQGYDDSNSPTFPYAQITTTFKAVDYAVLDDDASQTNELYRFVQRGYAYTTEYLTIQGVMQFVSRANNKALDTTPGMNTGFVEKTYTWWWVPADSGSSGFNVPNETNIVKLNGTCNLTTFDGNPPQTVLLNGVDAVLLKPKLRSGQRYWKITFKMLIKNNGAGISTDAAAGVNYIYDTVNQRWDLITDDGTFTGNRIYPTGELNNLFMWN